MKKGRFKGAMPKNPGAASISMKIKDQGTVPMAQPKKVANGGPPKPGADAGKARGGGAAIRGTNFAGRF